MAARQKNGNEFKHPQKLDLAVSNAGAVNTLNLPELMMEIWAKPSFLLCLLWDVDAGGTE